MVNNLHKVYYRMTIIIQQDATEYSLFNCILLLTVVNVQLRSRWVAVKVSLMPDTVDTVL